MGCCGPKCSKAFVILFNILFWISGCAFVALGVLLLVDPTYGYFFTMFTTDAYPPEILQYTAFGCIGLGGFILFVGFFGCCGALQDSKCMLGTYVFCLFLVLIVEAGVGLICLYLNFYFPPEVRNNLKMKIKDHYGMDRQDVFTAAVNYTQYDLECCGIEGFTDYTNSRWVNQSTFRNANLRVPETCCVQDHSKWSEADRWIDPQLKDSYRCQEVNDSHNYKVYLNDEGCWYKMEDWFKLQNLILGASCGGLALLMILGVAITICLMRNIGEEA